MSNILETVEDWQAGRGFAACNRFMLQKEIGCDVTFVLGQKKEQIRAHKYMLISRSSVFQSIFCGSMMAGENNNVIPVSDVTPQTFKSLLNFLYCDEASVDATNVKQLLYAAKKYAVKGLVDRCLDYLASSINVQNVCSILEQVHLYDGKNLEKQCFNFIYENADSVLKSQAFYNICPSCLEQIVKADELVADERNVYYAAVKWAQRECKDRHMEDTDENIRVVLGPVLFHIRFPLLDQVYFTNSVSTRSILNMEEIITIYQFFNGRAQLSNWKFCSSPRRGFSLNSVIRYSLISMEGFQSPKSGEADLIMFSCSEDILFHGASVYGSLDDVADYDVKIELSSEKENAQLSSDFVTVTTARAQHIYDVLLSRPVQLQAGKQYKVSIEIKGPPTKVGYGGKSDVSAGGVNFHFTNAGGRTSVGRGQIPGLLFTPVKKEQKDKG